MFDSKGGDEGPAVVSGQADKSLLIEKVLVKDDSQRMPPTPEELHEFLADNSSAAYEAVVDRLLNDNRHGERWARHWMDIWRYSDWYGRRHVPDVWNGAPQIYVHGATDELGYHALGDGHYVTDLHATVLHLLGLDNRRLEVPGRKRLEIDHGQLIDDILT